MKCLYCQQEFIHNLQLSEIFTLQTTIPQQLCSKCENLFEPVKAKKSCPRCRKANDASICLDCRKWQKLYPDYSFQHHALFQYTDAMHDWCSLYKFKGHRQLAASFSRQLHAALKKISKRKVIVPIPLSQERFNQRGFNQVEELLAAAHIPYLSLLKKSDADDTPQSSKTRKERLASKQPFSLTEKQDLLPTGKEILLVDDIYTTGRTLFHAADCLKKLHHLQIETFSLAR